MSTDILIAKIKTITNHMSPKWYMGCIVYAVYILFVYVQTCVGITKAPQVMKAKAK